MGSFNATCALTRSVIDSKTDVVVMLLTRKQKYSETPVYVWDLYAPIPILFEGRYNSYGSIENARLFQSLPLLSADDLSAVEKSLVSHMTSAFASKNSNIGKAVKSISSLLKQPELGVIKDMPGLSMAKTILALNEQNDIDADTHKLFVEPLLKRLKLKTIEDVKTYVAEHESEKHSVPLSFMMMRKDALGTLLRDYGIGDTNEDHYAPQAQALRQSVLLGTTDENVQSMMDYLTVDGSFAGANAPAYTFRHAIKTVAESNVAENMTSLSHLQGADITLLNDYLNVLGIPYQPTMLVNEDIKSYGHIEAFEMQRKLLEVATPSSNRNAVSPK